MRPVHLALVLVVCAAAIASVSAFSPPSIGRTTQPRSTTATSGLVSQKVGYPCITRTSAVELHLFRRLLGRGDKKNKDDDNDDDNDSDEGAKSGVESKDQVDVPAPFFAAQEEVEVVANKDDPTLTSSGAADSSTTVEEPVQVAPVPAPDAAAPVPVPPPPPPAPPISPETQAEKLRAQAERVRLEAEKMEITLTLEKIVKLEKELGNKKAMEKDPDRASQIRRDIDSLKKKLSGEDAVPAAPVPSPTKRVEEKEEVGEQGSLVTTTAILPLEPKYEPLASEEMKQRVKKYEESPRFMKEIIARTAGVDYMDIADVNATALIIQLYEDEQKFLDIQKGAVPAGGQRGPNGQIIPKFSQKQIDKKVEELKNVPQFVKNFYGKDKNNDTAIALQMLETEYESDNLQRQLMRAMESDAEDARAAPTNRPSGSPATDKKESFGSTLFGDAFKQEEKTEVENMVEALFPPSTRKEGMIPSQAQANILMTDVLTKIKSFSLSGKPEQVPGGYIIRGTNQYETGQELIDAIDAAIAKSRVKEQLLVHYVGDPTPVSEEQMIMGEREPVLYVTSTDIARDGNRLLLAGVTSLAIGTSWYTSLYPFLLNPTLLKSSEEQLNLANAGMEYDLGFITDMAVPLFATFMGIQVAHEAAHWAVAKSKKMEITGPTLVPSLVAGITSSITALKKPAKNKQDLFDFAIVGPLTGVVLSCLLLFVGCGITATADATAYANLPALPLDLLRQSALGGGIIEFVLGDGMLSAPASAAGTAALADVNISLHPFAIAGYFGLLINAINLIPFGRTDGGRVSLALFGRSGAQAVGFITLIALLIQGLFASDLLLFYFSFIAFFQSEAEIPCRNEVDDITFSRVLLSTFTGVLVLLSLIPMG